jgi:hypothetical protein
VHQAATIPANTVTHAPRTPSAISACDHQASSHRRLVFLRRCILAKPAAGAKGEFRWAATFSGAVLIECAILACNRGRCPLTRLASRYTDERRDNFDIYLPLWLARNNKVIFGALFLVSELYVLARWVGARH